MFNVKGSLRIDEPKGRSGNAHHPTPKGKMESFTRHVKRENGFWVGWDLADASKVKVFRTFEVTRD